MLRLLLLLLLPQLLLLLRLLSCSKALLRSRLTPLWEVRLLLGCVEGWKRQQRWLLQSTCMPDKET